ncbi:MAG: hypothetical protein ACRCVP_18900 [Shewanella xiamenensis]
MSHWPSEVPLDEPLKSGMSHWTPEVPLDEPLVRANGNRKCH